jgi:Skp family chaperone for outer membrane proteins
MDVKKFFVKRAIAWLILGLIGGGVAADWWERQRAASDISDLKTRHADQLKEVERKITQLTEQLKAERERREALEGVLAGIHKGS